MSQSAPRAWRNTIQRYQLLIEVCGKCGEKNLGRDICPYCGAKVVPEGENIFRALREGRKPQINGELEICVPQYGGKERKG